MIRALQPADSEAVAALIREAFAAIPVKLDPAPSALRETGASILGHLGAGGGAVWDVDGPAGCILWRVRDAGLYIGRLAVRPECWGQGIARGLLDAAEVATLMQGQKRIHLEVRLALTSNRRLFAAAGFCETRLRAHEGYSAPTFVEAEKVF